MRYATILMISAIFVLIVLPTANAKPITTPPNMLEEKTEDILLQDVQSDDIELKGSSVYTLGELHSQKAVIPLMKVLKSDNDERARLSAALSLYKIGDERGIYAIKKAIQFDESERVQRICRILYTAHLNPSLEQLSQ